MFDLLPDVPGLGNLFGGGGAGGAPSYDGAGGTPSYDAGGAPSYDTGGAPSYDGAGGAPNGGAGVYNYDPSDVGADAGGAGGAAGASGAGGQRGTDSGPAAPVTRELSFVADDGTIPLDAWALLTGHGLDRPQNVAEMAAAARVDADPGTVSQIEFVGHGGVGWQSTGDDNTREGKVTSDLSASDRQAFADMGALLTPDGEILFGGCNVAADDGAMMRAVAQASQHDVRGGTARQLPWIPGIEGPERIEHPDGTHELRTNWFKDAYGWADDRILDVQRAVGLE